MPASARPKGLLVRAVRKLLIGIYRRGNFTAKGTPPSDPKYVLLAVPHTSNWDFPNFLGLTEELGLDTHFMAKKSLFTWPIGRFMRQVGGVSVDRSGGRDMVAQMRDEFARRSHFILTIAPEGTRSAVDQWRTGFYRIAMAADVPIICGYLDYQSKCGGIGPVIHPTGDYDKDMAPAHEFYRNVVPKHPGSTRGS